MKLMYLLATALAFAFTAWACDTGANLKAVNQSCKDDSECYNGGNKPSVSCKGGLCKCNAGYMAQLQWFAPKDQRLVCVSAPYRNQECTSECQKPFICFNSSMPGTKTCQCRPPFIDKDGFCYLECKQDEIFEFGECRKRCFQDQNKVPESGLCKKIGKLGEPCEGKNECWAPFSLCVKGKCVCENGFAPNANNDACESKLRWCPLGDPILTRDHKIVECKVVKKQDTSPIPALLWPRPQPALLEDTCGQDQFCMLTSGDGYYTEGAIGHCCPLPKLKCPYGNPHPNATCGRSIPDRGMSIPNAPYCPYGSYSCIRFALGGGYENSLCCPTVCCSHQVLSGGKCYPRRDHGDVCQVNEQCKGHSGFCENFLCTCGKGYVTEGSIGYKYCRRVCGPNEVVVNNERCVPKLKLGAPCDAQIPNQCPTNSYCSEKKICDCFCGYVKLGDDACAPQPSCPAIEAPKNFSVSDVAIKLADIILCRIPGSKVSSDLVVNSCPKGQYCSDYVPEYGLCCPKPEKPFCPENAKPANKCDPKMSNACGPMAYCYRYMNAAGNDDSIDDFVCCHIGPIPFPLSTKKP